MASTVELAATICLGIAVLHTFFVSIFQQYGSKFPEGSIAENIFHLLGEVEVVFGFWAAIYLLILAITQNMNAAIHYLEKNRKGYYIFVQPFCYPVVKITLKKFIALENLLDY